VEVPKKDDEGNAIRDEAGEEVREVLLSLNATRNIFTKLTRLHLQKVLRIRFYTISLDTQA
jgi:hypothetical protein